MLRMNKSVILLHILYLKYLYLKYSMVIYKIIKQLIQIINSSYCQETFTIIVCTYKSINSYIREINENKEVWNVAFDYYRFVKLSNKLKNYITFLIAYYFFLNYK